MATRRFTIIDDGRATEVDAEVRDADVRLGASEVHAALGWDITEDGLCREGVCTPAPATWARDGGVELTALAAALGRPVALDTTEGAAWLGVGAADRGRVLASLSAPDFALPDVAGRIHRLSDYRGKKVLLVVWASW